MYLVLFLDRFAIRQINALVIIELVENLDFSFGLRHVSELCTVDREAVAAQVLQPNFTMVNELGRIFLFLAQAKHRVTAILVFFGELGNERWLKLLEAGTLRLDLLDELEKVVVVGLIEAATQHERHRQLDLLCVGAHVQLHVLLGLKRVAVEVLVGQIFTLETAFFMGFRYVSRFHCILIALSSLRFFFCNLRNLRHFFGLFGVGLGVQLEVELLESEHPLVLSQLRIAHLRCNRHIELVGNVFVLILLFLLQNSLALLSQLLSLLVKLCVHVPLPFGLFAASAHRVVHGLLTPRQWRV